MSQPNFQLLCSVRNLTARGKQQKPTFCISQFVGFFRCFRAFWRFLSLSESRRASGEKTVLGPVLAGLDRETLATLWVMAISGKRPLGNSISDSLGNFFFLLFRLGETEGFRNLAFSGDGRRFAGIA